MKLSLQCMVTGCALIVVGVFGVVMYAFLFVFNLPAKVSAWLRA